MGLKIDWRVMWFLPLIILLVIILNSGETKSLPVNGNGCTGRQCPIECGPGEFVCQGGLLDSGACCIADEETCTYRDLGGELFGQCDDNLPNGNFIDVTSTASCVISVPSAGYCGGSCKKTIEILPDACTKKITLTSVRLDDDGETAAGGNVLASDYSCTCRSGSIPLSSCALFPNSPDGTCSGGTTCGSETGSGCTATRSYNTNVPFTRGTPISAYIYALDDCKSRSSGIWGEGRATYIERRAQCDSGYKCDASTGSPQCILSTCGNNVCDAGEDAINCPQDCQQPQQVCGNNLKEGTEECDGTDLFGETCQSQGFTSGTLSCTGSCTLDTSGCTAVINDPIGNHDTSDCTSSVGWTCDADDYTQALNVELYADGLKGSGGVLIASVLADITREQAVANQCGGNPSHGFLFNSTPDNLKDGLDHSIYAYGINTGLGNDTLLSNSPQTINCAPPPSPPTCTFNSASWSTSQTDRGNNVALTIQGTDCDSESVDFFIAEVDCVGSCNYGDIDSQDTGKLTTSWIRGSFSGNQASVSWIAEWVKDENNGPLGDDDPEYVFEAELVSNQSVNIDQSGELKVNFVPPPSCSEITICDNYISQSSCNLDDCNVAEASVPISIDCGDSDIDCFCSWDSTGNDCNAAWNATSPGTGFCGDGIIDPGEQCDGSDWGAISSCIDFGLSDGNLSCNSNCQFDTSQCIGISGVCGDNTINPGETCDGSDWGAISSCIDFGLTDGNLSCSNCQFDTLQCTGGQGGSKIGQCIYTEQTSDTCEDDGFLTFSWTATWTWDPGNINQNDPNNIQAKCVDGQKTVECPAQIPLPFFGFYNIIAVLIMVSVVYMIMSTRKK